MESTPTPCAALERVAVSTGSGIRVTELHDYHNVTGTKLVAADSPSPGLSWRSRLGRHSGSHRMAGANPAMTDNEIPAAGQRPILRHPGVQSGDAKAPPHRVAERRLWRRAPLSVSLP